MYACIPSGENVIPASSVTRRLLLLDQLTIRGSKAVGYDSQSPSRRIKTIDLITQAWLRTEVLPVAIHGISEIDMAVTWIYGDVVDGVELPPEVVVHED